MVSVSLSTSIDRAVKKLNAVQKKQVPFALSKTINQLAFETAKKELPAHAERTFEGGATPYTKRGFKYKKGTKRSLAAKVYVDADTHQYLTYQIKGGMRTPQGRKIMVPTDHVKKNKYGNVTRGKRARFFNNKDKFFQGVPKGRSGTAYEGVWERYRGGKRVRMVGNYVNSATYKPKFNMALIIKLYVTQHSARYFEQHLRRALATARR